MPYRSDAGERQQRKAVEQSEGAIASAEYYTKAQAAIDRIGRLRELRLANKTTVKSPKRSRKTKS
jgi:hypothetical protein